MTNLKQAFPELVTISQLRVCVDVVFDFRATAAAPRPDVIVLASVQQRSRVETPIPLVRAATRAIARGRIPTPRRRRISSGLVRHQNRV